MDEIWIKKKYFLFIAPFGQIERVRFSMKQHLASMTL